MASTRIHLQFLDLHYLFICNLRELTRIQKNLFQFKAQHIHADFHAGSGVWTSSRIWIFKNPEDIFPRSKSQSNQKQVYRDRRKEMHTERKKNMFLPGMYRRQEGNVSEFKILNIRQIIKKRLGSQRSV